MVRNLVFGSLLQFEGGIRWRWAKGSNLPIYIPLRKHIDENSVTEISEEYADGLRTREVRHWLVVVVRGVAAVVRRGW
jgi:elongation factor P hydroxylase